MKKQLTILLVGLLSLISIKPAQAQNDKDKFYLEVEVSSNTPLVNQELTVQYKLKYGGRSLNLVNPRMTKTEPDFGEGFKILRQGRSGGMSFDFGSDMTVYDYVYVLQPLKEGSFTIPSMTMGLDGATYTSKEVNIKVLPNDAPPSAQHEEKIFVEAYLSNHNPYEGEEIYLSYKLFSKYHLNATQVNTPQVFDGFASDYLNKNERTSVELENHNGQKYQTAKLNKYRLYPLNDGEHFLDALTVDLNARIPTGRRDPFWGRDVTQNQTMQIKSPKLRVRVKPLPTQGKPSDFSGAVGKFNLNTTLSDTTIKAGEPLTLKIKVSGDGNMKLISEPKLKLPPGFEAYDPKIKQAGNSKSYEYLLIPSHAGNFEIAPYSFSYFDPKEERYVTRSAPTFKVTVGKGDIAPIAGSAGGGGVGLNKEEVAMLGQDIRYIMTALPGRGSLKGARKLMGSGLFYGGLTLPIALAVMLIYAGRMRKQQAADVVGNRTRKATKVAQKRLKEAEKFMQQGDRKAFYDESLRSIWGYLADKFSIEQGQLSRDKIKEVLGTRKVSEASLDGLVSLLDRCEMALFAPAGGSPDVEMRQDFDAAIDLISKIESEIA